MAVAVVAVAALRYRLRLVLVFMPAMAGWVVLQVAVLHLQMPQQTARRAARDSWKPRARHLAQAVLPEALVLQALLLLLADCSAKAAGAVVARVAAAHTQQVLAGLAAMDGHLF